MYDETNINLSNSHQHIGIVEFLFWKQSIFESNHGRSMAHLWRALPNDWHQHFIIEFLIVFVNADPTKGTDGTSGHQRR